MDTRWVAESIYADTAIPPPTTTKTYPPRQPSQYQTEEALDLESKPFGPTRRLPLGILVHARSGDKGSDANCGFWISTVGKHPFFQSDSHSADLSAEESRSRATTISAEMYTWLRNLLSIANIKLLLGRDFLHRPPPLRPIEIDRFELPKLQGVHFLFRNLLDRGVTSTGSVDFLGKNVAEFLRNRHVEIPVKFLEGYEEVAEGKKTGNARFKKWVSRL